MDTAGRQKDSRRDELLEEYLMVSKAVAKGWQARIMMLAADDNEGLSPAVLRALYAIGCSQKVSVKQLATELHMTSGAVTQFCEPLVRLGYVQRQTDKQDRRVVHLVLTPAGQERLRWFETARTRLALIATQHLSDVELARLVALQQKVLDGLGVQRDYQESGRPMVKTPQQITER